MPNMLKMTARQFSDPMILFVLVVADDGLIHDIRPGRVTNLDTEYIRALTERRLSTDRDKTIRQLSVTF